MSQHDSDSIKRCLDKIPYSGSDAGPVFSEPWQAQAFAMAVKLSEAGYFSWQEWVDRFSAQLKKAADLGQPDDGTRYYQHWLLTLEQLVAEKGLVQSENLEVRKHEWIQAYLNTPHGMPVALHKD